MRVSEILAEVAAREAVTGTRIISIDGPSGAGKSTLARQLAEAAGAPLIEIDDFVSWDNFSGWWPRFDEQVLSPLLAGRDAVYQARDWANDWLGSSLGGWKTVAHQPLIIVEGVTCTRRETVGRLAYAIWVDAPAEVRLQRGLARDHGQDVDVEGLWRRWMAEEAEFFAADGTRDRADLILTTA